MKDQVKNKLKENLFDIILIVALIIGIFLSLKYAGTASAVETYAEEIATLDSKRTTILGFIAAAAGTCAVITALPDDLGSPIATKIMDISGYFTIVLAAIYLEKYLLTIMGYFVFKWILPICFIILILAILFKNESFKSLAIKVALFAVLMYSVVPFSVKISNMIDTTYSESVQISMNTDGSEEKVEIEEEETDTDKGLLDAISDKWNEITDKVESGVTEVTEDLQQSLNNFIEALAVMIVTSCLIPILVLFVFAWITKLIFGVEFNFKRPKTTEIIKKEEE